MLHRFLFETRAGCWLLAVLERLTGLAVVSAESVAELRFGMPAGGE